MGVAGEGELGRGVEVLHVASEVVELRGGGMGGGGRIGGAGVRRLTRVVGRGLIASSPVALNGLGIGDAGAEGGGAGVGAYVRAHLEAGWGEAMGGVNGLLLRGVGGRGDGAEAMARGLVEEKTQVVQQGGDVGGGRVGVCYSFWGVGWNAGHVGGAGERGWVGRGRGWG